ncbi:MAG: DUF4145 domain-containing protein [Cyclobacteriaceae bacterium]
MSCSTRTNQLIRAKFKPQEQAECESFKYNEYCIIECLGCNNIAFIHQKWDDDEEAVDEKGEPLKWASHFMEDERWFEDYEFLIEEDRDELPAMIYDLYEELTEALQHQSKVLAGVGLRMLVEAVCVQQKIPGRNLKLNIENLFNKGAISKNEEGVLDKLREIGNISAHQIKGPSDSILEAALLAVNHLLRSVYIIPKRTRRLRRKEK